MLMRFLLPKSMFQERRENLQVLLIRELGTKFLLTNKNTRWPCNKIDCLFRNHMLSIDSLT